MPSAQCPCSLVVQGKIFSMMSGKDLSKLLKRLKKRERKENKVRKIVPVAAIEAATAAMPSLYLSHAFPVLLLLSLLLSLTLSHSPSR